MAEARGSEKLARLRSRPLNDQAIEEVIRLLQAHGNLQDYFPLGTVNLDLLTVSVAVKAEALPNVIQGLTGLTRARINGVRIFPNGIPSVVEHAGYVVEAELSGPLE